MITAPSSDLHTRPAYGEARRGTLVRQLCYAIVWLTFALSSLVLVEPAPVDALSMGLAVLLPAVALVEITPALCLYVCLWLAAIAAQLLAATQAPEMGRAIMHTVITTQLVVVSVAMAGFIAQSPVRHTRLVLSGWLAAATVAALAAIAGYFDLIPGSADLFTLHERGTGTFKDPNVFGPFLIAPILYALHLALTRPLGAALPALACALVMSIGVFLSFSRGAWACLALSIAVWSACTYAGGTRTERGKLMAVGTIGIAVIVVLLIVALQLDAVARLMEVRASLSQSYDQGPDGRFGGQLKALALIAEHPLGIGSLTFSPLHHHEEAHNVYLSMVMNAGWLGGSLFFAITLLTIVLGFSRLRSAGASRPYLVIASATFLSLALEGAIIDSDHWRHLYLLMGLVWGLASARRASNTPPQPVFSHPRARSSQPCVGGALASNASA